MSEDGFHVHGAHEHAVEHHAQSGDNLASQVAIFTAILASLAAVISYQGSATQNESMLMKNDAVLKKAQASDQWNYYEAKSYKGHLMELAGELAPPDKQGFYKDQLQKYEAEKKEVKSKAEELDIASDKANQESEHLLRPHHKLAQAMTLIQIAISLASITVLTRKKWLFLVAAVAATIGIALWGLALLA